MYQDVEAKPCPFCGCDKIRARTTSESGRWITYVECSRCMAQMGCDYLQAALERWNEREYDPALNRAVAHMKQVEWENQQLLKQMEEIKRIYRTDLATVKRDSKIAAAKFYEEELRLAKRRATMMEEALTITKKTIEEE